MKTAPFFLLIIASTLLFACKNENKEATSQQKKDSLSVADSLKKVPEYLYVTAHSGLSLREFNNLQSKRLVVMPYASKVKVTNPEEKNTMTVEGIAGGMDKVVFNEMEGYAFNGYLSPFSPPLGTVSAKRYAALLQEGFPKVAYADSTGGTASRPTKTEIVTLPTQKWHDAFFIAQRLFDIPLEFPYPGPKGKDGEEIKKNIRAEKNILSSELHVFRQDNGLQKIAYVHRVEGSGFTVTIAQEGDFIRITKTVFVE